MKDINLSIRFFVGLMLLTIPYLARALVIDNGLSSTQGNYFSVDVLTAGSSQTVLITDPSATRQGEDIVYLYDLYVVIDGESTKLSGSEPKLLPNGKVSSNGTFTGSAGNTIKWTVESAITNGAVQMRNAISFSAESGTLGDIQVIQYMDEDVNRAEDDVFFARGTAAQNNVELFTLDDDEIAIGVSQGGAQFEDQGLINANFDGWAACVYGERQSYTDGSTVYTPDGVICSTLDSLDTTHPDVGSVKGPADTITTIAWSVEPDAKQSIIISTLGGVPDVGVVLAVDDYIELIENADSLKSKVFDALENDVALDQPISFQTLSVPTNGTINVNPLCQSSCRLFQSSGRAAVSTHDTSFSRAKRSNS